MRYTIALLHLGRQLSCDRERLALIRARLARTGLESERLATRDEELSTRIAAIYQDTISTYRYRIQVSGSAAHLQTERVAERIRTLLLAGLRAAVLWRFVGGSRTATVLGRYPPARRLPRTARDGLNGNCATAGHLVSSLALHNRA